MSTPSLAAQQRRFTAALGVAIALSAVFAVLLASPLSLQARGSVSVAGFVLGGVLVVISGGRAATRSTPRARRVWRWFTTAALIAVAGNLWSTAVGADPVLDPSLVTEASIAVALLLSIAGLVSLPAIRVRGPERALIVLDGLVMGAAVLLISSITVFSDILDATADDLAARAWTLVIPMLDVILMTVSLLLILVSRIDRVFLILISGGFLLYAVSDLAFAVGAANDDFVFGSLQDMGWISGYFLLGAAAWYVHDESPAATANGSASLVQRSVVVFGAVLVAVVAQVFIADPSEFTRTQMVLWLVLAVAVGARQTLLTADNNSLRQGLERRVREQTADLRSLARRTEILLSSVGDGIYGVDTAGCITFVNPSGAEVLGRSVAELLGVNAHDHFHGLRPDGSPYELEDCYVTGAIERGVVSSAEDDIYIRGDGSTFPVEITASPLLDDDVIQGAVVAFRDVTQRHEVERMKNEFLSVVSHELRTPLTSIRGSLGLLAGGVLTDLTPQAKRMLSIAVESSDRLTRLINDILDIERIESGRLPINLAAQDVAVLLESGATELAGLATTSRVRIEVGTTDGRVMADPDRILQTLTNLLGNAVKFSEPGSIVQLSATVGTGSVTISVRDTGRGIPEDKLETVFQPFEQVDSSDSRKQGGTGLGLAISRGIVQGHGGRIWAEATPGGGTTVRFTLPRVREVPAPAPDGTVAATPVVLVCDDDPATVLSLSEMLNRHGFRPIGVTSGAQAIELAVSDRPAAVLVDLTMPGTPGSEVVAALKGHSSTHTIPVVVISGHSPASDPALADSAHAWLVKPIGEDLLMHTLGQLLEQRVGVSVLVVEDDEDLSAVLATLLAAHGLHVTQVATVAEARRIAPELSPRVMVLDLDLPDGDGVELLADLQRRGKLTETSVVVYSAVDTLPHHAEELITRSAVFLTKSRVTPEELEDRVLRLMDAATGGSTGDTHGDGAVPES